MTLTLARPQTAFPAVTQKQAHFGHAFPEKMVQGPVNDTEEQFLKAIGKLFGNSEKLELTSPSGKNLNVVSAQSLNQAGATDRSYVLGQLADAFQARLAPVNISLNIKRLREKAMLSITALQP